MKWLKIAVPDDFDPSTTSLSIPDPYRSKGNNLASAWEPPYMNLLDHGHVGLVDFMGSDHDIAEAARVSYARGTKKVSTDGGLIRYLLRHRHTTPFEMCEVKFHVKAPIFVFRQWHRHRTASINEMSARYSVLDNEMYLPGRDHAAPQSSANKQGREDDLLSETDYLAVIAAIEQTENDAYETYRYLLGGEEVIIDGMPHKSLAAPPDTIRERMLHAENKTLESLRRERDRRVKNGEPTLTAEEIADRTKLAYDSYGIRVVGQDYPGLARELARMVLPVATYSQMYWKTNLWNAFNFLRLRQDAHAQYEIRVYADAMYAQIQPLFPEACRAYEDYIRDALSLSKQDQALLGFVMRTGWSNKTDVSLIQTEGKRLGMSQREIDDFVKAMFGMKEV